MRFKNQPIKRKLMLMILIASGTVLLIISAIIMSFEWLTFRSTLVEDVTTVAEVIARNSTAALAFKDQKDAVEILAGLRVEGNIKAAALFDSADRMLATYVSGSGDLPPKNPKKNGYQFMEDHLVVSVPVKEARERYGTLVVVASLDQIQNRFSRYALIVLLMFLFCLLAAFLLSSVLQKSISAPILSLADAAKAVSEKKDYSVRAAQFANDELGMLTQTFNDMLTQIQEVDGGLRKALYEKDVLIQEMHHRVKNNLQVILSLIDMQSRNTMNPESSEVFKDCKSRIRSIALVHDILYRTSDFTQIDFSIYAVRFVEDLLKLYSPTSCTISSVIQLPELKLAINKAVPLGLLLNEIITNSLKHGFTGRGQGRILLEQRPTEGIVLIASDDGIGIPLEIDFREPKSFGLKIIQLLAEQLDAQISLDRSEGTRYTIQLYN
jgi:two-component sensor histidine kinase